MDYEQMEEGQCPKLKKLSMQPNVVHVQVMDKVEHTPMVVEQRTYYQEGMLVLLGVFVPVVAIIVGAALLQSEDPKLVRFGKIGLVILAMEVLLWLKLST